MARAIQYQRFERSSPGPEPYAVRYAVSPDSPQYLQAPVQREFRSEPRPRRIYHPPPAPKMVQQQTYSRRGPKIYALPRATRQRDRTPLDDGMTYEYHKHRAKRHHSTSHWIPSGQNRTRVLDSQPPTYLPDNFIDKNPHRHFLSDTDEDEDEILRTDRYEERRNGDPPLRNPSFVNRFQQQEQDARRRDVGDRYELFDPASQNEDWRAQHERTAPYTDLMPLQQRFDIAEQDMQDIHDMPPPAIHTLKRRHRPSRRIMDPTEPSRFRLNMTNRSSGREKIEG